MTNDRRLRQHLARAATALEAAYHEARTRSRPIDLTRITEVRNQLKWVVDHIKDPEEGTMPPRGTPRDKGPRPSRSRIAAYKSCNQHESHEERPYTTQHAHGCGCCTRNPEYPACRGGNHSNCPVPATYDLPPCGPGWTSGRD